MDKNKLQKEFQKAYVDWVCDKTKHWIKKFTKRFGIEENVINQTCDGVKATLWIWDDEEKEAFVLTATI